MDTKQKAVYEEFLDVSKSLLADMKKLQKDKEKLAAALMEISKECMEKENMGLYRVATKALLEVYPQVVHNG
jgi:putative methionine-R-sulfoxide reductase with GAF domain